MAPEFGKVEDIVVVNDSVFLSLRVFVSDFFVSHFNCYKYYLTKGTTTAQSFISASTVL